MSRRRRLTPAIVLIGASLTQSGARDIMVDALTAFHVARVAVASAQGATTAIR